MSTLALTGGTGFVGGALIDRAIAAGHDVRALTRRPQPEREGVVWIDGALDSPDSLDRLVAGADAVIHVAGVVNAPDRAGFVAGNVEGTRAIVVAAERVGVRRFIHVSSLAAREPALSAYGWSKAEAEKVVEASALDWVMVRPPAIYGPGDMEMRDLFRLARWGIALLPPPGKLSVIEVSDLARLLLALVDARSNRRVLEADDGKPGGWTHDEFARAIGHAVGQRVMPMALPQPLLRLAARGDRLVRGARAKLTPDRVAYFCHPDWRIDAEKRPDPAFWRPEVPTLEGLAATARWYRAHSLL
ncbi:nucleoside-diphosphate-sugar epimerase [Hephaestia caeni]|uniref:Nucleoside-diphosphate-sugar epimerase n=1 Tax=Hephaestia caeni TaxID=645617 RepID=A0A397PDA0_9SPHN|nr:NAD(P)H-binding protein [Hephaestia caeni]RIA43591.1 nucleoside-diphosphate-sugar epimerase [Hephaestia caeni]